VKHFIVLYRLWFYLFGFRLEYCIDSIKIRYRTSTLKQGWQKLRGSVQKCISVV